MSRQSLEEWATMKKCCCPHPDAYECARIRSPEYIEDRSPIDEPCECCCHDSLMEEDEG
jgi:hypothetical protein